MVNIPKRAIIVALFFIPTLITGFILTKQGRPVNSLILTVHKLASLVNLIILNITFFQMKKVAVVGRNEMVVLIVVNFCFIITIITGGMVSTEIIQPEYITTIHRISPWLTVLFSFFLLYLFN